MWTSFQLNFALQSTVSKCQPKNSYLSIKPAGKIQSKFISFIRFHPTDLSSYMMNLSGGKEQRGLKGEHAADKLVKYSDAQVEPLNKNLIL